MKARADLAFRCRPRDATQMWRVCSKDRCLFILPSSRPYPALSAIITAGGTAEILICLSVLSEHSPGLLHEAVMMVKAFLKRAIKRFRNKKL